MVDRRREQSTEICRHVRINCARYNAKVQKPFISQVVPSSVGRLLLLLPTRSFGRLGLPYQVRAHASVRTRTCAACVSVLLGTQHIRTYMCIGLRAYSHRHRHRHMHKAINIYCAYIIHCFPCINSHDIAYVSSYAYATHETWSECGCWHASPSLLSSLSRSFVSIVRRERLRSRVHTPVARVVARSECLRICVHMCVAKCVYVRTNAEVYAVLAKRWMPTRRRNSVMRVRSFATTTTAAAAPPNAPRFLYDFCLERPVVLDVAYEKDVRSWGSVIFVGPTERYTICFYFLHSRDVCRFFNFNFERECV